MIKLDIAQNRQKFLDILNTVIRTDVTPLVNWLSSSDFFEAPASYKYHLCVPGGLCMHSLMVYENLKELVSLKGLSDRFSDETLVIVGLLHDISKTNLYEKTARNKKVYSEYGLKHDEVGKFDWVAEVGYAVREDAMVYGSHEETSEFMVRSFIPLSMEESIAILHHMGGTSWDSAQDNIMKVYNSNPLTLLLHMADSLATFLDENDLSNE